MSEMTTDRRVALTATLLLTLVTVGCNSSASPTAPAEPVASNFVTQSNAQVSTGEELTKMWATVTSTPELIIKGSQVMAEMEVSNQMSRKGMSFPAILVCGEQIAKQCSALSPKDEIQAVGRRIGRRRGQPSWLITDFRRLN